MTWMNILDYNAGLDSFMFYAPFCVNLYNWDVKPMSFRHRSVIGYLMTAEIHRKINFIFMLKIFKYGNNFQ